jgi:hypothetical protein
MEEQAAVHSATSAAKLPFPQVGVGARKSSDIRHGVAPFTRAHVSDQPDQQIELADRTTTPNVVQVTRVISSSLARTRTGRDDGTVLTAESDNLDTDRGPTRLYGAVFHGTEPPDPLLPVTDSEQLDPRVRWLAGVHYGAIGRYHPAAELLTPRGHPVDSLTASTRASHLRQLSRHAEAEELDQWALAAATDPEGRSDALVGLVADAVGSGDADLARHRLATAAAEIDPDSPPNGGAGRHGKIHTVGPAAGWRAVVRLDWVRAEVALLSDRPGDAVAAAERAVRRATAAGAPRHLAKSQMFLGVATSVAGEADGAIRLLRLAVNAADARGLVPLVWPSRLMLAQLLESSDQATAARERRAATLAIHTVIWGLPTAETATLLARPEIRPLVGAYDVLRIGSSHKVTRTDYSRHAQSQSRG